MSYLGHFSKQPVHILIQQLFYFLILLYIALSFIRVCLLCYTVMSLTTLNHTLEMSHAHTPRWRFRRHAILDTQHMYNHQYYDVVNIFDQTELFLQTQFCLQVYGIYGGGRENWHFKMSGDRSWGSRNKVGRDSSWPANCARLPWGTHN